MNLTPWTGWISRWSGVLLGIVICGMPTLTLALEFKPSGRGVPGRREGAGTRAVAPPPRGIRGIPPAPSQPCIEGPVPLTAIMPQTNLGLTTAEFPRFFWFLPPTRAPLAEFKLVAVSGPTANEIPIYVTQFRLTGNSGLASLALPKNAGLPPLVVGQDYRWSLTLICNPSNLQQNIGVDGVVQRVQPTANLNRQLTGATAEQRLKVYAQNGLWFETLDTLAELWCARPQSTELAHAWQTLMQSVKLPAIATQPPPQRCP